MTSRFLMAAALAAALGCAGAQAQTVKLGIAPEERLGPATPEVLGGFNFGNWMQMSEYGDQMGTAVPPATLRFPGGNVGDDTDVTPFQLDTLVANLQLLGVKPTPSLMMQTRVFQAKPSEAPARNQPEDAADAVRMAKERGLPVKYWEVGNEPDLFATTRGDASWTAERYCEVFRAQAAAIRAVDPTLRITGPAVSGAVPDATRFTETFLRGCGDVVDVLTWHIYPTAGDKPEAEALASVADVDALTQHYKEVLADPVRNPLGYQRKIGMGVTEYGLSWKTDRPIFLNDMPAAFWAVETAIRLAQSGVEVAHYFAYQGVGFHGLLDISGTPRPTFYAYRMLEQMRGDFVAVKSDAPEVWSHGVRQGKTLRVLVSNTAHQPRSIALDLPRSWRLRTAQYFTGEMVETDQDPKKLKPARTLKLPAQSMALLEFRAR